MFRFIHTSDLHLGKRFGNFSGDLPARLREARHQVITRLARLADEHNVDVILLAGDTFDSETPAPDVRRQALVAMAAHRHIKWVILPGNHDSLQAAHLWNVLCQERAENIILALEPQPISLTNGVTLLPAPCTTRRLARDLTAWMDGYETAQGVVRIGLAHGAVRNFCEAGSADDIIAPDRAKRAHLDYLALGDWHGRVEINPRTHYCGTPEPDRFKHPSPGSALLVTIPAVGAMPEVTPLPTASFRWLLSELRLLETDDPTAVLSQLLPEESARRQTLLRFVISGYSRLAMHTHLIKQLDLLVPDFAFLDFDDSALSILYDANDLDDIGEGGALRAAAEALLIESRNEALDEEMRAIAGAALSRLYFYAQEKIL